MALSWNSMGLQNYMIGASLMSVSVPWHSSFIAAFHDTDTDILARIFAGMSAYRASRRGSPRGSRCRRRGMRASPRYMRYTDHIPLKQVTYRVLLFVEIITYNRSCSVRGRAESQHNVVHCSSQVILVVSFENLTEHHIRTTHAASTT